MDRLSVYRFSSSTPVWWKDREDRLTRLRNVTVSQIPARERQALAALAQRAMQWQVTVQDGSTWVGDGAQSVEINPLRLVGSCRALMANAVAALPPPCGYLKDVLTRLPAVANRQFPEITPAN